MNIDLELCGLLCNWKRSLFRLTPDPSEVYGGNLYTALLIFLCIEPPIVDSKG